MKTPTAHDSGASIPCSLMICELVSRPTVTMQSVWFHHVSRNTLHLHWWTWDRATYTCARLAIHQTEKSFLRLRRSSTATLRANRCAPPAVAITFNISFLRKWEKDASAANHTQETFFFCYDRSNDDDHHHHATMSLRGVCQQISHYSPNSSPCTKQTNKVSFSITHTLYYITIWWRVSTTTTTITIKRI